MMPPLVAHFVQVAVAALGGLLFHWLGAPAAWLSGSLVAVVVWRAVGPSTPLPKPLADLAMLVSGATMGGAITPQALAAVEPFTGEMIEGALKDVCERLGLKPRQAFQPIRVAVTGSKVSPGLYESLELLGKDESLARLRGAAAAAAA